MAIPNSLIRRAVSPIPGWRIWSWQSGDNPPPQFAFLIFAICMSMPLAGAVSMFI
jgi:hypothetical protein